MLTDIEVRKAPKPVTGTKKMFDGQGLFLAVAASGSKIWRMKCVVGGREQLLTFGAYPGVSLAAARGMKNEALVTLKKGGDPRVTPPAEGPAPPFSDVARAWHKQQSPAWASGHAKRVLEALEADVFPMIGSIPITEVTPKHVLQVLKVMETRSVDVARRLRQKISSVYKYAIASDLAIVDPAASLVQALAPHIKGERPAITNLQEAQEVLRVLEAAPAHPITKLANRFLALTAVRPWEMRYARWEEFEDLDGAEPLWKVPGTRMKMRREHWVPLAPDAVDVLKAVRGLSGNGTVVFPSTRDPKKVISENAIGFAMNRAGYQGQHCAHGWRATFSTIMNERSPEDEAVVELMLAHVKRDRVGAAYNRALHLVRRRAIARDWAQMLMTSAVPASELIGSARR